MYSVDKHDKVILLTDIPLPDSGAPCPILITDSVLTYLIYYSPLYKKNDMYESEVVLIEFEGCIDTMFGGLNVEALHGHHYTNVA